jgi:hypothetical protein
MPLHGMQDRLNVQTQPGPADIHHRAQLPAATMQIWFIPTAYRQQQPVKHKRAFIISRFPIRIEEVIPDQPPEVSPASRVDCGHGVLYTPIFQNIKHMSFQRALHSFQYVKVRMSDMRGFVVSVPPYKIYK